ncbi:hypothetical protein N9465_00340 [Gammaproteobacteria bacterium]|nr:hypothetical protein [Gammaproteobacteria bacterium]
MAIELDDVSKLMVANSGWIDQGDGTVTDPSGNVNRSWTKSTDENGKVSFNANVFKTNFAEGGGFKEVKEVTLDDTSGATASDTSGTTDTVSGQTEQAFQGTAGSSGSAAASEATVDTGIVENQNPVNVGSVDNLEGVTVPDYASSATHYNSATGQYGNITTSGTETVGTGTYIDQVVKDADGNTVLVDKEVEGEPEEVITIKAGAEPAPELFTFDVNDISAEGGARFGGDARSYIDVADGKGGTVRLKTNREAAITQDMLDKGLGDHTYYGGNAAVADKSRGTGGEVARVFNLATDHINKLNVEQQKKIDAWKKENEIKTLQSTTKIVKVPKIEKVEQTKTINKFGFNAIEKPKEEEVVKPVNLMDSNVIANQSPDVIPGNATGVTQAEIDRNNQAVLDQMSRGSPVTSVSVPQPTYATYEPTTQTFQPQAANQTGAATSTYGMANVPGTQQTPLQTAGLSAVPQTVQVKPQYTGTTLQNVSSISQQGFGGQRIYTNAFGQEITVSVDATGNPLTYKPPGFYLKGSPQDSAVQQQQQSGQTGGQNIQVIGAPQRGTGSTPYTGPMSSSVNVNPGIPQPSLSQLSTSQELIIGPDGWRVRNAGMYQGGMTSYALGGDVQGQLRLANKFLGYQGEATKDSLDAFLNSNPGAAAKMGQYEKAMSNMAQPIQQMYQGGPVRGFTNGGDNQEIRKENSSFIDPNKNLKPIEPDFYYDTARPMAEAAIQQTMQPIQAPVNYITPQPADFIGSTAGQTAPIAPMAEAATVGNVTQSQMAQTKDAGQMTDVKKAQTGVATEVAKLSAQTGDKPTDIPAQQQTTSAVTGLDAAAGQMQKFDPITGMPLLTDPNKELFTPATNEYKRKLTKDPITGDFTELVSGSANAAKAAQFTEQMQADTALPSTKATVAGQLDMLMRDFEGGDTPAWAAGSMRAANAAMLQRGLGASSMAGQAIIQATMEAALPIAMADAQTQASFEAQNLSNRQARSMLAAQQRAAFIGQEFDQAFQARVQNAAKISDIANQNFSADQTIQLENSRAAQTLSLTNLSNTQALVMSEAAALAGLDTQNLNNRQQAAVQNAQNFLQMDMANLTNKQQTAMFKTQQNVQALFTDQAADNASKQFNATSTNQTNQFFANLATQTAQFNAAQTNAMDQFNVNAVNGLREFNSNIQQQRDMFNAQNGLVIAQANAKWRQDLTTLNNATQNESNMDFAKTINALTSKNIDAIWQRERDLMDQAYKVNESKLDRAVSVLIADKTLEGIKLKIDEDGKTANAELLWNLLF